MSTIAAADPTAFQDYVGRTETLRARINEEPVHLLASLLDRRFDEMSPKGVLPPLWHLLIVPPPVRQSEIGPDGHPKRGPFLPPITYPRRMFAGATVRFLSPLFVGEEVVRTTTIKSITPKSGRSGNLIFVTISNTIEGPRGVALTEEQNLVFRETDGAKPTVSLSPNERGKPTGYSAVETIHPDPVLLFRYSVATNNTHRIHYDLEYVRTVEGYPDLVVHGPLQAIMLADLATRYLRRPLNTFAFRIVKPVFLGNPFFCVAQDDAEGAALRTLDAVHDVCTSATAT
ncbi:MAG: FAS1-like dehydratase domain-containing protein [Pseudolabrys sp.]